MLPNLLLIGEAKAGTTSIHRYLDQHPNIFMSEVKEPGFFAFEGTSGRIPMIRDRPFVTALEAYEALFDKAGDARIIGESSPFYLDFASSSVISRIRTYLPAVRILAIVRHPVDQAYSRFVMWQRGGRTRGLGFREAFLSDMATFHDLQVDFRGEEPLVKSYHDRLRLYVEAFDEARIKIMVYDDLVADPARFMADIYRFLDVDTAVANDFRVKVNQGGMYRFKTVAALLNRPNPVRWLARRLIPDATRTALRHRALRYVSKPAPPLDPDVRAELCALVSEEITNLERLVGRDLSAWRARPA